MTAINLSLVPAPDVVETIDFEAVLADLIATLRTRYPEFTADVESEPVYKLLEVAAFRELVLRQRINDSARAVMLATATGADLENLGALYGVVRLQVTPAQPDAVPPVEAVMEDDDRLRVRIQLALEGFSTAGPIGAYLFHTLSADPTVLDAGIDSPVPGTVRVTLLSADGDGTADAQLQATVLARLNDEDVRPLTDTVQVQSANIIPYTIEATLTFYPGPDAAAVLATAQAAIAEYVVATHRVGHDVTLSGVFSALHQSGVQNVTLTSPTADIVISPTEAPWCSGITVNDGGIDV